MPADEAAVTQVHQLALDGGLAAAPRHREVPLDGRPVARGGHRAGFVDGNEKQLVLVRNDDVALQQVAQLARLQRTGPDLGHGCGRKALGEKRQQILVRRQRLVFGGAARDVRQPARARHQPDTDFDQADVAFHCDDAARRIDSDLASTTQRQAADGRNHRHRRIAHAQHCLLHELLGVVHCAYADRHECGQHRLQVGAHTEGVVTGPDHQSLVVLLGQLHRLLQAFAHLGTDGMHLGLDACDQHPATGGACRVLVESPQPDAGVFVHRLAGRPEIFRLAAQHGLRKQLARMHRQQPAGLELSGRRIPGACRRVNASGFDHGAAENPVRQRRVRQRLAGLDVFLDPPRHRQPPGLLPEFERTLLHAETPAHREIDVARGVRNRGEVNRRVVKAVAQDCPQELPLRPLGFAQQLQALRRGLLQHAGVDLVALQSAGDVVAAFKFEAQHVAAGLLVKAGIAFLPQVALLQQYLENFGRRKTRIEGVALFVERVLQRLDHMTQRVESHNVRGPEGARTGAAHLLAGEIVRHIVSQAEFLDFLHGRQQAGDADPVGDEVGRVPGPHHALSESGGDKGFQLVEDPGLGAGCSDQFHQRHVARGIEKMDAAESVLHLLRQRFAQHRDRQARRVRRQDGVRRDEGRDLAVEGQLPVHPLGDGLDDEVAVLQLLQVLLVVRLSDQRRILGQAERRGLELLEALDRFGHDGIFGRQRGRCRVHWRLQVEQQHRNPDVHEVGRNLRAHHPRAEHGDLLHAKTRRHASASCVSIKTFAPPRAVRISMTVSGNSLAK